MEDEFLDVESADDMIDGSEVAELITAGQMEGV